MKHARHPGLWALPLCFTPEAAYHLGMRDGRQATIAVHGRVNRTVTGDPTLVTCQACLAILAKQTAQALGERCQRHGPALCSCRPCLECGVRGCSPVEHRDFDPDFNGA